MKPVLAVCVDVAGRRAPYGARGLKHFRPWQHRLAVRPRPVRGAWVETARFRAL